MLILRVHKLCHLKIENFFILNKTICIKSLLLNQDTLNMGIQTVVQEGVKIMDMFADTESEQYQAFKSMLTLWNPESSKWAVQASKGYKKALNVRASRYVISYTYNYYLIIFTNFLKLRIFHEIYLAHVIEQPNFGFPNPQYFVYLLDQTVGQDILQLIN